MPFSIVLTAGCILIQKLAGIEKSKGGPSFSARFLYAPNCEFPFQTPV
jgi:hypothetical protein